MPVIMDPIGYRITWRDCSVNRYSGYSPNMSDYHMHDYYEISIIISGKVKVLLPESTHSGTESRIVLTGPMTPHLVVCEPELLYERINILFSTEFIAECPAEWKQIIGIFGKKGRVLTLDSHQLDEFITLAEEFEKDTDVFRRRLWLMIMLSKISDISDGGVEDVEETPAFVSSALIYIQENYSSKILSNELAWKLGVGRTTLLTAFKKYTGNTLNGFITDYRLHQAIKRLEKGELQQVVAVSCGFGDSCNMIRAFKARFGITPGKYMKRLTVISKADQNK